MKKNGNLNKVILIIICVVLVLGIAGCIIYIFTKDNNDNNVNIPNDNNDFIIDNTDSNDSDIESSRTKLIANYEEITKMENGNYPLGDIKEEYFIVKYNNKYGVIDYGGNVIEEIKYDKVYYLIDDYYYVEVDGVKTLKRNGNVVDDISKYQKDKVYKDNNDEDSLYIMLNEYIYNDYLTVSEDANIINLEGTLRAVYYKDSYDIFGLKGTSSSIVYDASTGNIVSRVQGAINKSEDNKYMVTYQVATYMRNYTYYDSSFKMMTDGKYYFSSAQCDGNSYASAVTDHSKKYGYYSVNKDKLIIPIQYQNIYSVNDDESLFVVKNNNKYALLDDMNNIILPFEYEYMIILNDYIVTVKDNSLSIYDSEVKIIDKYVFKLDKNKEIAGYGLCDPEYKYVNVSKHTDNNLGKINFYTGGKLKTLLFYNDSIELYEEEVNIVFGYSDDDKRYIIMSSINDNLITKVEVYDEQKNKLFDINTSSYDISLSYNEPPLDYASSIYNVSYDFDCRYFIISYNGKEKGINKIYFDLDKQEVVDNAPYLYCKNIDNNYFYYPVYNKNNSRDRYELYSYDEKIIDFVNDIEKIRDDYFLVDRNKIYKINE